MEMCAAWLSCSHANLISVAQPRVSVCSLRLQPMRCLWCVCKPYLQHHTAILTQAHEFMTLSLLHVVLHEVLLSKSH
jgi:hypothetical protein